MIVSAWSDGRGFVYGFRVLGNGRSLYFRKEWESIVLSFPDTPEPAKVPITPSFWGACPVLRARAIRSFLARNGLIPWPRDHPPHFVLNALGGGSFRLEWLEHRPVQPTLGLFEGPEPGRQESDGAGEIPVEGTAENPNGGGTLGGGEQAQ